MQKVPRLYETFQPDEYRLEIELQDRASRVFRGSVGILGNYNGSSTLMLHAKDLTITLLKNNGEEASYTQDGDHLIIDDAGEPGHRHLVVIFEGKITDSMHGLYPCYFEVDGSKKELLATQFESHHAREVFPCVDEPEAKAIFNLALITENDVTTLSNMPIRTVMPEDDKTVTVFDETPKMSPYLLAFVVGELQKKTAHTKNGTEVNIYATHAQSADSLDFGLDVAVRSIEFFNEYFDTPYPLPKADHVALPDFSSAAMENWGLITYREMALLADKSASISTKELIAVVIAHETSHQWFGNLVTMKWWDDLWLNESFATLMEYVAVDALFPKWNIWMTFASQESLSALRRDYLSGVQPVKIDVNHPDEISSLFDPSIVYAKGGRLLKMLHAYIGEEAFRSGLKAYFKKHAYGNTRGSDLWAAFSDATGNDIGAFMDTWLAQPNFPKVAVVETENGYLFNQTPFVIGGDSPSKTWPIPLGHNRDDLPLLLDTEKATAEAPHVPLLLNQGNSGHFVPHYSSELLAAIRSQLASGDVSPIDRLALLHETSLLARAGDSTASELWRLLLSYAHETEEPVWDIMSLVIADMKRFVETDPDAEEALKSHLVTLATPLYEKLGWDEHADESESDTKLRSTILGLMTYAEYQPVIEQGLKLFRQADDLSTLNGELRGIIFAIAGKCGTHDDWQRLFDLYKTTQIADLQQDALGGMTITKDEALIATLLEAITNEAVVRQQDVDRWFVYLIRNRYAREAAWKWMTSSWSWIEDKFESDKSYDSFPRYAATGLSTLQWKQRFDEFFEPLRSQPALTRAIELGSKDIESRAVWIERDSQALLRELKQ